MDKCEKCSDDAIGFSDDGEALCCDCLFEQTSEDLFYNEWGDEED